MKPGRCEYFESVYGIESCSCSAPVDYEVGIAGSTKHRLCAFHHGIWMYGESRDMLEPRRIRKLGSAKKLAEYTKEIIEHQDYKEYRLKEYRPVVENELTVGRSNKAAKQRLAVSHRAKTVPAFIHRARGVVDGVTRKVC